MAIIDSYWRLRAAPIIARVLAEHPEEGPEQRKALHAAYPFGQRRYWPYQVWLSEIKLQRGGRRVIILDPSRPLVFGDRRNPYGKSNAIT